MTGRARPSSAARWGGCLGAAFLLATAVGAGDGPGPQIGTPPTAAFPDSAPLPGANGLPLLLPVEEGVKDPVFAILIGMMEADLYGELDRERLEAEVRRQGTGTALPLEHLQVIQRLSHPGSPVALVRLVSLEGLDIPAPYDVLGYHPGRLRASRIVEFEEWSLGTVTLEMPDRDGEGNGERVVIEEVRLWGLRRGRLEIDVDGWLDLLLGARLDDTRITGFSLFRYRGRWVGLAMGYNPDGRGRSGSFSFLTDKVLFPSPPPYKVAAIQLRRRLEQLMPALAQYRRS